MNGISLKEYKIMVGTSGERHFNVKSFYALAVFIICIYYFSSVKFYYLKNV